MTDEHLPDDRRLNDNLVTLHTLRCAGVASTERVAAVSGGTVEVAGTRLQSLADRGWVRHWDGRLPGWGLTDAGRAAGERLLAAELDGAGVRAEVDAIYRRFLPLNRQFLELCRDWQVIDEDGRPVPNTHADSAHDSAVIQRLRQTHEQSVGMRAELADHLARFAPYEERFRNALAHVESGDHDWFTRPGIDSYHTVWFELHEDLLATLGFQRTNEREVN